MESLTSLCDCRFGINCGVRPQRRSQTLNLRSETFESRVENRATGWRRCPSSHPGSAWASLVPVRFGAATVKELLEQSSFPPLGGRH
jgi:hypothetical protein